MNWYTKFVKTSAKDSLLSILVTLYALELMESSRFISEDHKSDLLYYAHDVKYKFIDSIYDVCMYRIERVCGRIDQKHSDAEEDLVNSGVLQNNHPKLWNIITSGNVQNEIKDIKDVIWFYKEIYSDDINEVYSRGRRNNAPWLNIVDKTLKLYNSRGVRDTIVAIDGLKDAIHNTGENIVTQIPQGNEMLSFLNATANNDQSELLKFIYKYADKQIIDMNIMNQELRRQ